MLYYLLSLPPGAYLASVIGLTVELGPEKMALAGFNQDVWSHAVRPTEPPLKRNIKPHKNGPLWRRSSLYFVRQLPFKFLISSWILTSVSVESEPHLFLCPAQPCVGEQHTASVPRVLSRKWQNALK